VIAPSMPRQCSSSASGLERSRPVPLRALLDRLGSGVHVLPWSAYLPDELQPPELRAARAKAASIPRSSPTRPEGKSAGASPTGSKTFCLEEMKIAGRVWSLAQEAHGCRQVQEALDAASSDEFREMLASELRGHVIEASKCPHANHVLQRFILLLPALSSQFIIDELMAGTITQTARHKYGCRIIQRLMEHCHVSQVQQLVESVLTDIPGLSRHPYGNYVIQNILQHGMEGHRQSILKSVGKDIRFLGSESYGCAVVSAALSYGPDADRAALAQILLKEPGLLVFMASTRHGHVAALRSLELLEGKENEEAQRRLQAEATTLRNSRYGRIVVDYLKSTDVTQQLLSSACRAGA